MEGTSGTLYVVSTPIGNLGDMSPRAVEVLSSVDLIAAEDTRTTALLLQKFGISGAHMIPNHKFNETAATGKLVSELTSGKSVALVTDAGTPCISDPGYLLVREAVSAGVPVTPVPGCCAAVAAIAVSGFNALSFGFYGFLPRTPGEIRGVFRSMKGDRSPLAVYYEAPGRIRKTMAVLSEEIPDAQVCLCNDLTKKFERIYRGTPADVAKELEDNPNAGKGEYVLLVLRPDRPDHSGDPCGISPEGMVADRMFREGLSARDAVSALTADPSCPYAKNELYEAALRLKQYFAGEENNHS